MYFICHPNTPEFLGRLPSVNVTYLALGGKDKSPAGLGYISSFIHSLLVRKQKPQIQHKAPAPNGTPLNMASFNLQSSTRAFEIPNRTLGRRPRQFRQDDESEEEESVPAHEEVTGFDSQTGNAITANSHDSKSKRELVIPVTSTNDWRNRPGVNIRRPRGKNLLPKEVQALREAEKSGKPIEGDETCGPSMSYGLSYASKPATQDTAENNGDQHVKEAEPLLPAPGEGQKVLTEDEIALQALVRESRGDAEHRTDLVIESAKPPVNRERDDYVAHYDETSSFRADIASRPDPATLDAYNEIPVEEFGAALLRGMGWKEGQAVGRGRYNSSAPSDRANQPRIPGRRSGFLGIGAKELSGSKGAEAEIGAWGKAAMRKSSRKSGKDGEKSTGVYMPVLMRNKRTGEYITEEELAELQKEAKMKKKDEDDWRERRDRNLEKSGRDRDRDRDREYRRRDYENGRDDSDRHGRRRHGSSRRDRSISSSSWDSRRRRYDDGEADGRGDRYYRDRDRDKDRDRDRERSHRHRDEDYHSSRHSSSRYDRHRDSDRDRISRRRDDYR